MKSPSRETPADPMHNAVLRSLPANEWELLEPHGEIRTLRHSQMLFRDDEPGDMAAFPLTCIISMITAMHNGDECEYGTIGREGLLGLQVALGAQPLRGQALVQLEGEAVLFPGSLLRERTFEENAMPELRRLLLRYAQATINVLAQSAACNALHPIATRTARWILSSRDRAGSDYFSLTQDFLARMLGVRRGGVSAAAADLQKAGVIEYNRGHIRVLNRAGLEARSCECYAIIRDEYERVLAAPG
jgi:CRP-like cAMP-binding protein